MRTPAIRLVLFLVLSTAVLGASSYSAQQARTTGDFFPVPDSLDELIQRAPVVVRGSVRSFRVDTVPMNAGGFLVARRATLTVTEVIKTDNQIEVGQEIAVLQQGGTARVNGAEISSPFPDKFHRLLSDRDDVVLALIPWPAAKGYSVLFGSAGVFDVRNGRVHGSGAARRLTERPGSTSTDLTEFLVQVRTAARSRK